MKKLLLIVPMLALASCFNQPTADPNTLTYEQSQNVMGIERGVVLAVEQANVKIEGSNTAAVGGAVAGGIAGSQMSAGSGRDVAIAVGALAGAAIGKGVSAKTEQAYAYTVETKKGRMIQVVQGGQIIPIGSKVLIKFYDNKKTISLDSTQGVTFTRTKDTMYAEDDEDLAKEEAKKDRQEAYAAEVEEMEMEAKRLELKKKKMALEKERLRLERENDFIQKELELMDDVGEGVKEHGLPNIKVKETKE